MVHILDADDAPPVVRGLAVIDDGGFVTMGEEGNIFKGVKYYLEFIRRNLK